MNCLIYLRVSTKEQAETDETDGFSIKAQREACINYIKSEGWNFVEEYVDYGESARSADRPQLQEMLSRVKKDSTIDVVVIHKIDRLARNIGDHSAIKAILKKHKVSLVSVVEHIENSASGQFMEGMLALMAEYYSANLAAEVRKGMHQRVKQGWWPSKAPLGYLNEKVRVDGREFSRISVDPVRGPLIAEAFEMYATGHYSIGEITNILNNRGFTTTGNKKYSPRPVAKSVITRALANRFYVGDMHWSNMEFKGSHEPLVSRETFNKVQEILEIRASDSTRKRKHEHFLRGTVYCGECGSRMTTTTAKGQYVYFFCLGKQRRNGCKQSVISDFQMESLIEELYRESQIPKEWSERLINDMQKGFASREVDTLREKEFLNKRIGQIEKKKQRLLELFLAEVIDMEKLKEERKQLDDELAKANDRMQVLALQNDQVAAQVALMINMAANCYLAYTKGSAMTKRLFNETFFKKIYVKDKKISKSEFTEDFRPIFDRSSSNVHLVGPVGLEPTTGGL